MQLSYQPKPPRPRRNAPPPKPDDNPDGSQPLIDNREERIANLLLSGMAGVHAVKATAPRPCKYRSAVVTASRLVNRPDFARRLAWLKANRVKKSSPAGHGLTPELPQAVDIQADTRKQKTGVMSRDELIRELSALVRGAENEGTRVSAANALAKLAYDSAETVIPSPERVIEWLSSRAGDIRKFKPGVIALMSWCKAGLDDLRGVLADVESATMGSGVSAAETPQETQNGTISMGESETP